MSFMEEGHTIDCEEPKACCCEARICLITWFTLQIIFNVISLILTCTTAGSNAESISISVVMVLISVSITAFLIYGLVKRSYSIMLVALILQLLQLIVILVAIILVIIVLAGNNGTYVTGALWAIVAGFAIALGINCYVCYLVYRVRQRFA